MAKILVVGVPYMDQLKELFAGHTVYTASNGWKALKIYRREEPPFVLTAACVGGLDGCKLARQLTSRTRPPTVVITSAKPEEYVRWKEAGADAFVPVNELFQRLPEILPQYFGQKR